MSLRIVFMGTPDFAVPCLDHLAKSSRFEIIAVITQPDKPRGRGKKLMMPPVKERALALGIPVYQPPKVKAAEFNFFLRDELKPDLIAVVAFGQILPPALLALPPLGCINVHASLLPKYRGAAPMQRAIMAGEKITGVTTMFMDAGLDTGDILLKAEYPLGDDTTLAELHDALSEMGASLLVQTIDGIAAKTLNRTPQEGNLANYAPMIDKETERIDWERPAADIHNLVRALDSWPGAYTTLLGQPIKIWRTKKSPAIVKDKAPGEIISAGEGCFTVATGDGALEILEIQLPGKKRISAADYLRGHKISLPMSFG